MRSALSLAVVALVGCGGGGGGDDGPPRDGVLTLQVQTPQAFLTKLTLIPISCVDNCAPPFRPGCGLLSCIRAGDNIEAFDDPDSIQQSVDVPEIQEGFYNIEAETVRTDQFQNRNIRTTFIQGQVEFLERDARGDVLEYVLVSG